MLLNEPIKIFFWDDDKDLIESISRYLILKGHFVTSTTDITEALELLAKEPLPYDVILLDIFDSEGNRAGIRLLEEISSRDTTVKVVMLSAASQIDDAVSSLNLGAYGFLRKTQSGPAEILNMIELAAQAGRAERLHKQEMTRMRGLQQHLFPVKAPKFPGFSITAQQRPAGEVTGDFYEFIEFPPNELGIFLGDVMGHGVAAAFVTGITYAILSGMKETATPDAEFLVGLHRRLSSLLNSAGNGTYIAACYCILNCKERTMRYCILGSTPPIFVYRHATGRCLAVRENVELFIHPELPFSVDFLAYLELARGDIIVLCTDGVGPFDEDITAATQLIKQIVIENHQESVEAIAGKIVDSEFNGYDDKTVVVIKAS
ncbi:MAG: SpoIIE family protein phosphatase [Deltaproteobacteria bacterium]|nr:SpoIIE family protein phosphatase [Deltaproteobacteria bacterium]